MSQNYSGIRYISVHIGTLYRACTGTYRYIILKDVPIDVPMYRYRVPLSLLR